MTEADPLVTLYPGDLDEDDEEDDEEEEEGRRPRPELSIIGLENKEEGHPVYDLLLTNILMFHVLGCEPCAETRQSPVSSFNPTPVLPL